jgi:hypothetical protein
MDDQPGVAHPSDRPRLRYGNVAVGEIADAFLSDGTWFGAFRQTLTIPSCPTERRIHEYIRFCKDWNARSYADPSRCGRMARERL